jgi:1-acyl-sn-glycerol-3-phosphate acyltransferase
MTANVPIVPMGLVGMDNIWGNWFRFIRPKLQINIGKSFTPEAIPNERKERDKALKKTGNEIMLRIAALVPDEYHGHFKENQRIEQLRKSS